MLEGIVAAFTILALVSQLSIDHLAASAAQERKLPILPHFPQD